jgi:hypothetical protein
MGCEYAQYPTGVTASVRSARNAVEYRWVPLGGRRRELCAAWVVQANGNGGLVGITLGLNVNGFDGNGHVSVVGSTLTSITVRAHC